MSGATTLYLLRHGATAYNEMRPVRLQGCSVDGALSPLGQAQAESLARALADMPLAAVYCSRMLRARQTAEAVSRPRQMDVREVAGLHEIDVGRWEGKSWDEIRAEDGEYYARFDANPHEVPYAGGECYLDVLRRAQPAVDALLARHAGDAFAVVSHNVVIKALLAGPLGIPLRDIRRFHQANCAINILRLEVDGLRVVTLNSALHLPRE
jgi:broad specificity phosphatase PhoE